MASSTRPNANTRAVEAHREALQAAKQTVGAWAAAAKGERDSIAASMLALLSECAKDTTGDRTLNVVSELFDEYAELLDETKANALAHAIAKLAEAAHGLGRASKLHLR